MYNKLWCKILDSSVWLADNPTRIVWITFLASMDRNSFAHFSSVRNLARRANVSDEEAQAAVNLLESPDPNSETPDDDGRRIRRIQGGWLIINGEKYNKILIEEHKKELNRRRVQKFREAEKAHDVTSVRVTALHVMKTRESESESESDTSSPNEVRSSLAAEPRERKIKSSNNGKGHSPDPRHSPFKELIFRCYQKLNNGKDPSWGPSDAKQLALLLQETPSLNEEEFRDLLINYYYSKDHPRGDRPRKFIPNLTSYAKVIDRFRRDEEEKQ